MCYIVISVYVMRR